MGAPMEFTSVLQPTVTLTDGSMLTLTIDENIYLLPVSGLGVIWIVYSPREGEEITIPEFTLTQAGAGAISA